MATLRHIRRKIQSIRSTQTITNTMKMVSASKLRRAQEELERISLYSKRLEELTGRVLSSLRGLTHPLIDKREEKRSILLFACASDRGLCGAFNMNIITRAQEFLLKKKEEYERVSLYIFGKKLRDYFRKRQFEVVRDIVEVRRIDMELVDSISKELLDLYLNGEFDSVHLLYTHFFSPLKQSVVLKEFLPIEVVEGEEKEYLFEPNLKELLDGLLPKFLKMKLYFSLLNSFVSEHAARMNAMENASDNCGKLIESLTLLFNKTRQESITKEMMDIVGGAEALRER